MVEAGYHFPNGETFWPVSHSQITVRQYFPSLSNKLQVRVGHWHKKSDYLSSFFAFLKFCELLSWILQTRTTSRRALCWPKKIVVYGSVISNSSSWKTRRGWAVIKNTLLRHWTTSVISLMIAWLFQHVLNTAYRCIKNWPWKWTLMRKK